MPNSSPSKSNYGSQTIAFITKAVNLKQQHDCTDTHAGDHLIQDMCGANLSPSPNAA
jgi:hypothetical protein